MKDLLLSFEDFITGIGIWILVGCLGFCLIVSVIFLILNLQKEKKEKEKENKQFAESIAMVQKQEAENKTEAKPAAKQPAKKPAAKKPAVKKAEKVEEKPAEEKQPAKKPAAKKAPAKKAEEKPAAEEAPANYEIVYDAESKQWVVRKENSTRATKRTKTKQEAIDYAKPLADKNGTKLIIKNKN